jgi:hypothetical protein
MSLASVAKEMGWTEKASWRQGQYTTTAPSKRLLALLEPYRMSQGRWWALVVGSEKNAEPGAASDRPRDVR